MVVVRLNNYAINLLKLQHKINLKFLDTNKSTNKFFWCPTGWGNAKIMGANKNLLNFSGLIKPTSLLQSSRCFRQKISYFFTSECCVSVHPDKNSFSQADFRASRSCVCSCIWQPLAILKHPFRAAKTPNRDGKARYGLIPSMRLIPPGNLATLQNSLSL